MNIDKDVANDFINALTSMLGKNISNALNKSNIEFYQNGYVTSLVDADSNYVNVQLPTVLLENVPNLSGTPVVVNQKVKVFYNNRNMQGCYVGTAFF